MGAVYRVTCEDGVVRHGPRALRHRQAADEFAEWGHCCTRNHTYALLCEVCLEEGHRHGDCPTRRTFQRGCDMLEVLTENFGQAKDEEHVGLDWWAGFLYDLLSAQVGRTFCEPYLDAVPAGELWPGESGGEWNGE